MNLLWHQFRCDLRANRLALMAWSVMLFLGLGLNLGWIEAPDHHAKTLLEGDSNFWATAVLVVGWLLFLLIPALLVLANSPAKTDSFLDTRPMSKRDLYGAKVLFIVLLIVLPMVLQEMVYLRGSGLAAGWVVHGMLERVMWILPWLGLSMGFTALWRNGREWTAALVTALAGVAVFSTVANFIPNSGMGMGSSSRPVMFLYVTAGLVLMLAALNHRFRWSVVKRAVGLVLILVVSTVLLMLPVEVLPVKRHAPDPMIAARTEFPLKVRPRDFYLFCTYVTNSDGDISLQASINPQLDKLPRDWVIDWSCRDSELVPDSGHPVLFHERGREFNIFQWQYQVDGAEAGVLSKFLGPEALIFIQNGMFQPYWSAGLGRFLVPVSLLPGKSVLKSDLTGNIFRWEVAVSLPVVAGKSTTDAYGRWAILGATNLNGEGWRCIQVAVERDQVALSTSGDPAMESLSPPTCCQFKFVLYDENSRRAQFSEQQTFVNFNIGGETSFPRNFLVPVFNTSTIYGALADNRTLGRLKLIVLQKKYLGTIHRHWESPAFTLADYLNTSSSGNNMKNEQMSPLEFNQRLGALPVPLPGSSRLEVGIYLNDVLRLVEARAERLPDNHALIGQLAVLVPKHLEVFVAGLPATSFFGQDVLHRAIVQGALESQRGEIIAALPKAQELARVIAKRGWLEEARPTLNSLFDRGVSGAALPANAWFDDPATYPKMLEQFQAYPNTYEYDILHLLPGLATNLDQAVRDFYDQWPKVIDENGQVRVPQALSVGLRHGLPEALTETYRMFELVSAPKRRDQGQLINTLRDNLEIPGMTRKNRADYGWLATWLAAHRAKDFQYDAARGRFVLKPT